MSDEHGQPKSEPAEQSSASVRIPGTALVNALSEVAERADILAALDRIYREFGTSEKKKKRKRKYSDPDATDETESEESVVATGIRTGALHEISEHESELESHAIDMTPAYDDEPEVIYEIIEVRDPKLPLRFEKTDSRVRFKEATDPKTACGECAFFKRWGEGDSDGSTCALVEGRVSHLDTCNLFLSPNEAFADGEPIPQQYHLFDLAASVDNDQQSLDFWIEIPLERFNDAVPIRIPLLPLPGIYTHPRYGQIVISRERNARFVDNIKNQVYQEYIPIDADHHTKLSGAFGFIVDAELNEDGSADAIVEWNERGRTVLTEKRFRYISPEWALSYEDPATGEVFEDVVIAAALTNRPFFKEPALRAILANERGIWDVDEHNDGDGRHQFILQMCHPAVEPQPQERSSTVTVEPTNKHTEHVDSVEEPVEAAAQATDSEVTPEPQTVEATEPVAVPDELHAVMDNTEAYSQLPEEVIQAFVQMKQAYDQTTELYKAERQTNQQVMSRLEQSENEIKQMRDRERRQRYTDMVTGRLGEDDGAQWFGDVEKHVNLLDSLAQAFGEESDQFISYIENQRAVAAQQAQSELFRELGSQYESGTGSSSAWQQIEAKAQQYRDAIGDPSMTMSQAIADVTQKYPELHQAYLAEKEIN